MVSHWSSSAASVPSAWRASTAAVTGAVSGGVLREQQAVLVAALGGVSELADDLAAVENGVAQVERARQVDDKRVDLAGREGGHDVVVRVEDLHGVGAKRGDGGVYDVLPVEAPMVRPLRSASEAALAAFEPSVVTTAWLVV